MALAQYLFEGGSEGAAANNANSGSVANSVNAPSTFTFTAATKAHGSFGITATCGAAQNCFRRYPFAASATPTVFAFSGVVTLPASAPANDLFILGAPNAAGNYRWRLRIATTGALTLVDQPNTKSITLASAGTLTWGAKYRVTLLISGGSTSASSATGKVYSGTTAWTTQVGSTATATDLNFSTDAMVGVDIGIVSTSAAAQSIGWDDIQVNDGSTTEIGDYEPPANVPPTVDAGTDQTVNTGAVVTLTATATDSDGSIASSSWTQQSGPTVSLSGTGLSRTFTPTVAGVYVFRFSATDNAGATSTDDVQVTARGVQATPASLVSNPGGWTNQGGAATLVAAVSDSSDASYAETPDNPSAAVHTYELAPLQAGVVTIATRDRSTVASPAITRTVDILDAGGTVRGTTSFALTTTWTNHTVNSGAFSFTAGAVVRVRVSDTQAA